MDQVNKEFIMNVMANAKDLILATIRPDGYPQATTISFAYDDLTLYVGVGKENQKARNFAKTIYESCENCATKKVKVVQTLLQL